MAGHQGKKRSLESLHSDDKPFKRQRFYQEDRQIKGTHKISKQKTDIREKLNIKKNLVSKMKKKKAKSKMFKSAGDEHMDCASGIQNGNYFSKIRENKRNSLETDADAKISKAGCNKVTKNVSKLKRDKKKKTKIIGSPLKEQAETVKIELPKSTEEFSCNWKKLQSILQKEKMSKETIGKKPYLGKEKLHKQQKKYKKDTGTGMSEKDSRQPEIWFDDVDDILIDSMRSQQKENYKDEALDSIKSDDKNPLVKRGSYEGLSKIVAMDCEMVGVGIDGKENMLARVSIVNQYGHRIYDEYVKPVEDVIDYRTPLSGVREEDLLKGKDFFIVQKEVAEKLKGRILVGHAIQNDLKVLYLDHPRKDIRDTSRYKPFRQLFNGRTPSLKKLTAQVLNVSVQEGEHDSVQDAQAAMRLYTMYRKQWEKDLKLSAHRPRKRKEKLKKIVQKQKTL
ncbi:hypothetical protein ACJMK2_016561 [Sinanodonta woodiana]|uniref:RNA exonuclease 4 n=1 Tax=Sinanodonta woodiana TaxID=1069815 RepID=A0ABD3UVB0_SINWO